MNVFYLIKFQHDNMFKVVEATSGGGHHIRMYDTDPTRNMKICFEDKEKIYHKIRFNDGSNSTICCVYDKMNNYLLYKDKIYRSLSTWCKDHKKSIKPDINPSTNGWKECKIWNKNKNKWISINKIYKKQGNTYIKKK